MSLFYKKCDVCNNKIKKMNSIWDIFDLKSGRILKCENCETEYNTLKIIQLIGKLYNFLIVWTLSILLIVRFLDSFNLNLGIEVWFYVVFIYILIELIIMGLLPLKKLSSKIHTSN